MAPKIAAISSMVRLSGWMAPKGSGRGGCVTSIRSAASLAVRAASSSTARRAEIASVICVFSRLIPAPAAFLASGSMPPSDFNSIVTEPFLPRRDTRRASSPSVSAVPISPRARSSKFFKSSPNISIHPSFRGRADMARCKLSSTRGRRVPSPAQPGSVTKYQHIRRKCSGASKPIENTQNACQRRLTLDARAEYGRRGRRNQSGCATFTTKFAHPLRTGIG